MDLTTFHLLVIAVPAVALAALAPKLVRDGFGPVLVLEFVWLAVQAVGNLVGAGRNQPFNNLLFPVLLLIPFLYFAPAIWLPQRRGRAVANAKPLRPVWVLIVAACGVFVWINVRNL